MILYTHTHTHTFILQNYRKYKSHFNQKLNYYKQQWNNFWDVNAKLSFIVTCIVAFITNILMINGLNLLKGDGLKFAVTYDSGLWEISLGRWGIHLLEELRLNLALPTVSSIISIIFIAICSVLLIKLFAIKSKINIIIISMFVAVCPVLTVTLLFTYVSDLYCLALLLSVLSVYILYTEKNIKMKFIVVTILTTFMLSIYQSYIGVTLGLILSITIIQCIQSKDIKVTWKNFIINMFIIFIGCILYLIITFLVLKICHVELSNYKGAEAIGLQNILKQLPNSIATTYKTTYDYFFTDNILVNRCYNRNIFFSIFSLIATIILIKLIYRKKCSNILSIIILVLFMPIALDIIEVIMPNSGFYILEAYQFILPIILGIKLIDMLKDDIFKVIPIFLCFVIIYTYYLQANASYTAIELSHNQLYTAAIKISNSIENSLEYQPKDSVCIVGTIDNLNLQKEEIFKKTYCSIVNAPLITNSSYSAQIEKWKKFFTIYLGTQYKYCTIKQYNQIIETDEFKKMPVYPEKGYIQEINNVIVVKLNNVK